MNRIEGIKAEIQLLMKERELIQSECCHPPSILKAKHGDNDPDPLQVQVRHVDYECGLCGKRWREEECPHRWVDMGHGHNYTVYKCSLCGEEEDR